MRLVLAGRAHSINTFILFYLLWRMILAFLPKGHPPFFVPPDMDSTRGRRRPRVIIESKILNDHVKV